MQSEIAKRLKLKYAPVAILFSNEKPQDPWNLKKDAGVASHQC